MFNRKKILNNLSEYLNVLNIIFYLTVGIPLILFCIVYLKFQGQGGLLPTTAENFYFLLHVFIPVLIVITIIFAYAYYRKQLKQKHLKVSLTEKLLFFYQISVNKYIILCIANMLAVVGLYLSGEQFFAALYAITLVVFSFSRPTPLRIIKDLKLNKDEQKKLIHSQNLNEA